MRTLKIFTFLVAAILAFSCSKDGSEISVPDYSVLGLEPVVVNDITYPVKSNASLDVGANGLLVLDGLANQAAQKQVQVSYLVRYKQGSIPTVSVKSRYSDVTVVVKEDKGTTTTYTVLIARKNFEEQVTYVFRFMPQ